MPDTAIRPTLTIYRRPGCHLCADAEVLLRDELSMRMRAGLVTPVVSRVDISGDTELEARYGASIPVFAIAGLESDLVTSTRQVRELLERALSAPT